MPLPPKPIITIAEAATSWDINPQAIASYALNGSLTLSIVVKGVLVEAGEYIELEDGDRHRSSHGHLSLNGVQDVFGLDMWPAFRNGSTTIQRFMSSRTENFLEISEPAGMVVCVSDIVLRHEECSRFSQRYGLRVLSDPGRKGRGGPGISPRFDWDGFWIQVCRRLHNDGFPETQAALVRELQEWFSSSIEVGPDTSTVKKKVSRMWKELKA
ncbi:MAG: hypothetical protein WCH43_09745 [Verrucomicrobiota bacterium]